MKYKFFSSLIVIAVLTCGLLPITGLAQASKTAASKTPQKPSDPLMSLPVSDGVTTVDVQRLLNEMLPKVFVDDPTRLARVNARIDQIKTRTGIDVRSFDRVAIGLRFIKGATPSALSLESVALARGNFNAPVMLAAGLLSANSKYKYQQQKYGKKTIYIFNSDDLFGKDKLPEATVGEDARKAGGKAAEIADDLLQKIINFRGEVGITAIDENTLAIGQVVMVKAAIDASAGHGNVNVDLTRLATQSPSAVVGYGINVPSKLSLYLDLGNDQIATNLDAVRQIYGSLSSTPTGFDMQNIVRTDTVPQAEEVYNMLTGFKELGGFFVASLSGDKGKLAQSALDNLKITKEGNEVQIRLDLAQADVAMLVRVFDKRN